VELCDLAHGRACVSQENQSTNGLVNGRENAHSQSEYNVRKMKNVSAAVVFLGVVVGAPSYAQAPPSFPPGQLDQLVARIALYPDPLLAQVLAAATYPNDIPPATQWADQHHYLTGQALAAAISADQLRGIRASKRCFHSHPCWT
jgi:hypothetical protein